MQEGDTIICRSAEEAAAYADELTQNGWDASCESNFKTGTWTITIIGKKAPEAAVRDNKYPDMDEMIEAAKKRQNPDETIVFSFGVGRMTPLPFDKKVVRNGIEEGIKFIKSLDGFLGVHPIDVNRNLLLFDSLNNAKGGKNLLKLKDIPTGQIVPLIIKTEFLEAAYGHKKV